VSAVHLSLAQTLSILGVLMLTSKGAAAVSGGGFITLAATLSTIHSIPIAGLALLVGVDRFMAGARALTNLIGNAVATVVIAQWDDALDMERAESVLNGHVTEGGDDGPTGEAPETEEVLVAATYARSQRS